MYAVQSVTAYRQRARVESESRACLLCWPWPVSLGLCPMWQMSLPAHVANVVSCCGSRPPLQSRHAVCACPCVRLWLHLYEYVSYLCASMRMKDIGLQAWQPEHGQGGSPLLLPPLLTAARTLPRLPVIDRQAVPVPMRTLLLLVRTYC